MSATAGGAGDALDPAAPYKPLDVGNGRVASSVAADGTLLALSGPHPSLGAVTLGGAAPFRDELRHDAHAVRAYRAALAAANAPGFGLGPPGGWASVGVRLLGGVVPAARLRAGTAEATVTTWAPPDEGETATGVVQRWTVHGLAEGWAWRGVITLGRSALTQLTEGGVLPASAEPIGVGFADGTLTVRTPDAAAAVAGLPAAEPFGRRARGPVELAIPWTEPAPAGGARECVVAWALGRDADDAGQRARALRAAAGPEQLAAQAARWRRVGDDAADGLSGDVARLVRRAVTYALACCAWRVGDSVCLVTDHQILPLAWTRDAYYATQALLARPRPETLAVVGRHLRWLFEVAERPERLWGRAYLPNGRVKDAAFQLDQQCYPLLELTDYIALTGDAAAASRWAPAVREVVGAVLERRAPGTDLVATEETPGDDPMPLPYHFSSHVLLWRTLCRLGAHAAALGLDRAALAAIAGGLRRDVARAFTVRRAGRRLFAYAVDLEGGSTAYHDANDVPTALAPLWRWCAAGDAAWQATMRFAFSPANRRGWFPGRFGGLGSAHTPAPWPLGDVQELVVARLLGDRHRADAALARLTASACWDGALPEARDAGDATVRSRHWFAWPGAALAAALTHNDWQPPAGA